MQTLFNKRGSTALILLAAMATLIAVGVQGAGPAGAQTFGTPVAIPGATFGEPDINIAPGGAIYIDGPTGLGTGSPVYKSTNGGTTWSLTPAGLRGSMPGGGDSQIAVDKRVGTLYMVDLWLGSTTTSRSTNGAQTWTSNSFGTPVQDRPWVATASNGNVYMVTHQIPSGLVVSKSSAPVDGVVYSTSTVAASAADQQGCVCPPGNIIAEAGLTNDKVGVIYATSTGAVKFAGSTNGGLTFTNTNVTPDNAAATTNANFPVVADAGNGNLTAVWTEIFGTSNDRIQIAKSSNFGATWSTPTTLVSSATGTSVYPWVAANGSKVSVSVYHTSTVTTPDNAPANTQWFESYTESVNGGAFTSLVTVDPTPVKAGPVCTGGTSCNGNRQLLDYQTVALDGAGLADVAYARVLPSGSVQTMFNHEA
jgi:hypothetical protein